MSKYVEEAPFYNRQLTMVIRVENTLIIFRYLTYVSFPENMYNKLRGLSPQANYTDRATAACRRS
jgi:hypothetical protein